MTRKSGGLRKSIAGQLLKIIFGLYFVLAVTVTGIQLTVEYFHVKDSVLKEMRKLPVTFGPGISTALWTYNDALLQSILEGMDHIQIVTGVNIRGADGETVRSVGSVHGANGNAVVFDKYGNRTSDGKNETVFSGLFGHEFPITHTDFDGAVHEIGWGTVYSNSRVIIDRVKYGFVLILINSVIKTLGLWFIFLFFVRKILGRPLGQLAHAVEQVSLENLEDHEIDVHISGENELSVLKDAFNGMLEKLNRQVKEIRNARDELDQKVEERTGELVATNRQLEREIDERKRVEKQIKSALEEKEILLAEVHHRVKNNMQVVISLLKLQSGKLVDKQLIDIFKDSENRIRSMALVHENLYQTKDFANINFSQYVKTVSNLLFGSYSISPDKVSLNMEIEGVSLRLDHAIPCGLIINELISNSLKYAFPKDREGEIKVALRSTNDHEIELTVSDDGIGIPDGVDIQNAESMGLQLVHLLAENQLDGKIEVDRDGGTSFRIRFEK